MRRLAGCAILVAAVCACGALDRPTEVPALLRMLESSDPAERSWAVSELSRLGAVEAVPGLVARLRDEDGGIRLYAVGALRELRGEEHGFRPFSPAPEREAAVRRWEESIGSAEGDAGGASSP